MSEVVKKKPFSLLVFALILILGGGYLAYSIQTSGGIKIHDLRFMGHEGKMMSALLYVPKGVSKNSPAPSILATHGYINSRETQDGFAIEFARRGYVVLAIDQAGHGYSDPPSGFNGFGGIPGLEYLRSLDFVDKENIGISGHSMGGWASLKAAESNPNGYRSLLLESSSTGTYGTKEGTPTFPRNFGLIYSRYDEFSQLMWNSPVPGNVPKSDKLKKAFGTMEDVQVGKLYGSVEEGTARKLYQPSMIHPRVHFSTEAIGDAMEWMQTTLKGGKNLPPSDQIWYWKEIGTLIALIGMVLLLFPVGAYLLRTEFFRELNEAPAEPKAASGWGWGLGAVITILLPVPLYIWIWNFQTLEVFKPGYYWPQAITTVLMFWAVSVGAVSLILFLFWHLLANRGKGGSFTNYGFTWKDRPGRKIWKSFLLALGVAFIAHITLSLSDWAFKTDYRIWVFAVKPMSFFQFKVALAYFIPFAFYFLVAGLILHGELRRGQKGDPAIVGWKEMLGNVILMIGGYVLFLAYQYTPLFSGGTAAITTRWAPLYSIVMFQFLPIFAIVALVSTYFYRKTGHIFAGSFLNAMMITWIVVAGQATHFPY